MAAAQPMQRERSRWDSDRGGGRVRRGRAAGGGGSGGMRRHAPATCTLAMCACALATPAACILRRARGGVEPLLASGARGMGRRGDDGGRGERERGRGGRGSGCLGRASLCSGAETLAACRLQLGEGLLQSGDWRAVRQRAESSARAGSAMHDGVRSTPAARGIRLRRRAACFLSGVPLSAVPPAVESLCLCDCERQRASPPCEAVYSILLGVYVMIRVLAVFTEFMYVKCVDENKYKSRGGVMRATGPRIVVEL